MKLYRFKVDKLVRDKAIERMEKKGFYCNYSYANDQEYPTLLLNKLQEEAEEVAVAKDKHERITELADLLEVIHALLRVDQCTLEDVERIRLEQRSQRGGFDKRVMCHYVEIATDNPEKEYCLARPEKYPEMDPE